MYSKLENIEYWLYLEPSTYLSYTKEEVLLYNTHSGENMRIKSSSLLYEILLKDYFYITKFELEKKEIKEFIESIENKNIGGLMPSSYAKIKRLKTSLNNLERWIENEKSNSNKSNLKEVVKSITFFINEKCDLNCSFCSEAYYQFKCCTNSNSENEETHLNQIKKFLSSKSKIRPVYLHITGGNILKHDQLPELAENLSMGDMNAVIYHLNYKNIVSYKKRLSFLASINNLLNIIINLPLEEELLIEALNKVKLSKIRYTVSFIAESEQNIIEIEKIASNLNIGNWKINCFYNKQNKEFFEEFYFLDEELILDSKPSVREILRREKINTVSYGNLIVSSKGDIYTSLFNKPIGNIKSTTILEVVEKELENSQSWLKKRDSSLPCKECIYKFICPPPSSYEKALNQINLCIYK